MLLLAADTSGKHGSIGLARGNPDGSCDVIAVVPLDGGAFSAQLIPQVAALLAQHGFSTPDIGGFAVVSGPGSFTGLRVGLAAIKALAEVTGKPVAAVSLLEAVAVAAGVKGVVLAALDAGRSELYLGEYEISGARTTMIQERLVTPSEWIEAATGKTVVTPEKDVAQAIAVPRPDAAAIARLGWKKILAGDTVSAEALEANYIRRTDAEILYRNSAG
jgi:tRNA threonylcarbamoyladenosine biosynthesis protein TsaB